MHVSCYKLLHRAPFKSVAIMNHEHLHVFFLLLIEGSLSFTWKRPNDKLTISVFHPNINAHDKKTKIKGSEKLLCVLNISEFLKLQLYNEFKLVVWPSGPFHFYGDFHSLVFSDHSRQPQTSWWAHMYQLKSQIFLSGTDNRSKGEWILAVHSSTW